MKKSDVGENDNGLTDRAWVQFVVSKVRGALKATEIGSVSERTTRHGFVLEILDTDGGELGTFTLKAPVVKPRATKAKPALALGSGLSAAQAANLATLPAGELTLASLGLAKVRCKSVPPALASKVVWGEADGGVEGLIVAAHRPEVVAHDPEATFYPILMPPAGSAAGALRGPRAQHRGDAHPRGGHHVHPRLGVGGDAPGLLRRGRRRHGDQLRHRPRGGPGRDARRAQDAQGPRRVTRGALRWPRP